MTSKPLLFIALVALLAAVSTANDCVKLATDFSGAAVHITDAAIEIATIPCADGPLAKSYLLDVLHDVRALVKHSCLASEIPDRNYGAVCEERSS